MLENITFNELYEYIRENSDGDYNLLSYLDGFVKNMIDNSLYYAIFSWSESEIFSIDININNDNIVTYDVYKISNKLFRI